MNKEQIEKLIYDFMLEQLKACFKWVGLPENISQGYLENALLSDGYAAICNYSGDLFCFSGSFTGEKDYTGCAKGFRAVNSFIGVNREFRIGEGCAIVENTRSRASSLPLLKFYAGMLADNYISQNIASINNRVPFFISASDDRTRASADQFLRQIERGQFGIIAEQKLFESLKIIPIPGVSNLNALQENNRFIWQDYYSKIGLKTDQNSKKEQLSLREVEVNSAYIYPYIDNMLAARQESADRLNKVFGLAVSVEFASAWDYRPYTGEDVTREDLQNES